MQKKKDQISKHHISRSTESLKLFQTQGYREESTLIGFKISYLSNENWCRMKLKESDPFCNSEKMVLRSVYQCVRIKVALNLVSSHGKVTDQNDTRHKYSLILN